MKTFHSTPAVAGAALAAVLGLAACDAGTPEAVAAAPACTACHQGGRSFAGREAKEVAERIRTIRDGKLPHPPLGLADSSDAAIEALARTLVAPG